MIVATYYFTKWVEAESLAVSPQVREVDVKKIIRNILSWFGIPRALVSDNGNQFVGQKVKKMLDELKIEFYNSKGATCNAIGG